MINSMHLPDGVGKDLFPTNRSIHLGKNTDSYYADALDKVERALEIGVGSNWTSTQYHEKIMEIITPIRGVLTDGSIKINEAMTIMN